MELPEQIELAVSNLSKLPGIGGKTALRKVLSMLAWEEEKVLSLANSIKNLTSLQKCIDCGFFCSESKCSVCLDSARVNSGILCVVESVTDCIAVENTQTYNGLYTILGGVLNPLLDVGPKELGIDILVKRVKDLNIKEVILALNPSVEGDATCSYLKQVLPQGIKVDRIGFGIPVGGSLEYLDAVTIATAIENRKIIN